MIYYCPWTGSSLRSHWELQESISKNIFEQCANFHYSRSRIRRFLALGRVSIFNEILGLGAKIPKIPKLVPDLFGPSGASVGLPKVIFGFLGVSGMIFEENQKFLDFSIFLFYFSHCHEWRISLLMQNDQKWSKITIFEKFSKFSEKCFFFKKSKLLNFFNMKNATSIDAWAY